MTEEQNIDNECISSIGRRNIDDVIPLEEFQDAVSRFRPLKTLIDQPPWYEHCEVIDLLEADNSEDRQEENPNYSFAGSPVFKARAREYKNSKSTIGTRECTPAQQQDLDSDIEAFEISCLVTDEYFETLNCEVLLDLLNKDDMIDLSFLNQPDHTRSVGWNERNEIIRWFLRAGERTESARTAVHLATSIFDRYLALRPSISLEIAENLKIMSFFIAIKYDGNLKILLPQLIYINRKELDIQKLFEFEFEICKVLEWKITCPSRAEFFDILTDEWDEFAERQSPFCPLPLFRKIGSESYKLFCASSQALSASLMEGRSYDYTNIQIAIGVIYYSLNILVEFEGVEDYFTRFLESKVSYLNISLNLFPQLAFLQVVILNTRVKIKRWDIEEKHSKLRSYEYMISMCVSN